MMKRALPHLICWLVRILRATCRVAPVNDPRPALKAENQPYIYCALHAQQVALIVLGEPGAAAIVSRSKDGELIARALEQTGVKAIRGSSGGRKGGAAALLALVKHMRQGNIAALTVDGPNGPRGWVNPGVAMLSQKTGAPVLPLMLIPSRRVILKRTWDRVQIPLPFSRVDATFSDPVFPVVGESVEDYAKRIETVLRRLERQHDPDEAVFNRTDSADSSVARAA